MTCGIAAPRAAQVLDNQRLTKWPFKCYAKFKKTFFYVFFQNA